MTQNSHAQPLRMTISVPFIIQWVASDRWPYNGNVVWREGIILLASKPYTLCIYQNNYNVITAKIYHTFD